MLSRIHNDFRIAQRRTVLTNDQIIALPTTLVEVVPAPAAGRALALIQARVYSDFYTAYSNITTDGWLHISQNGQTISSLVLNWAPSTLTDLTDFLEFAGRYMFTMTPIQNVVTDILLRNVAAGSDVTDSQGDAVGMDISIFDFNEPLSVIAGGHPKNTLTVDIIYADILAPFRHAR